MPREFGLDAARMQRRCTNPAPLEPVIQRYRVQYICGLGSPICGKWLILSALEIRIVDVHIADLVSRRRERGDAAAWFEQRHELVDEHEMSQVIRTELSFEAVFRLAPRTSHHPRIRNNHIEWSGLRQQFIRRLARALE